GLGIWSMFHFRIWRVFKDIGHYPILALDIIAVVFCLILLGFLFGMPQIAKWVPGDSPTEQKANDLSKKLGPYQVIIGLVGVIAALIAILYNLNILKVTF